MNCPKCNIPLSMSDRQGVEIDYCQQCRGVWLDRGEIDKIVERELAAYGPLKRPEARAAMPEPPFYPADARRPDHDERRYDRDDDRRYEGRRDDDRHRDDDRYRHDDKYRKKKKRESFLEDLFDFG